LPEIFTLERLITVIPDEAVSENIRDSHAIRKGLVELSSTLPEDCGLEKLEDIGFYLIAVVMPWVSIDS